MNDSPKPSAPAGIPRVDAEVEIPDAMFFEAGDYNVRNTRREDLAETRRKVSRHRSMLKARVTLMMDDFNRISTGLHSADRQGNAAPHWDSAVVIVAKLELAVSHLAAQIEKAEARYEESFLAQLVAEHE